MQKEKKIKRRCSKRKSKVVDLEDVKTLGHEAETLARQQV